MSSERTRPIVIACAVGAIAAGAGYYFFRIHRPNEAMREAREEVVAWESRWTAARGCLLGATPASSETSEALALHELAPDPWNGGACTGLVSMLTRGPKDDTAIQPVEAAWSALDHAATKVASAFAEYINAATGRDALAAALDTLDAAGAELRSTVELPAEHRVGVRLPVAHVLPLGGAEVDFRTTANAAGGVIEATRGERHVQLTVRAGVAPRFADEPPTGVRVLDGDWGAAIDADHLIAVGALGSDGGMSAPAVSSIVLADGWLLGAFGSLEDGVIAWIANDARGEALVLARVHGAQVTIESSTPVDELIALPTTDGRELLTWSSPDRAGHAQIVGAGAASHAFDVPVAPSFACWSADRAWLSTRAGLYAFDGATAPTAVPGADGLLIGCAPEGAVLDPTKEPREATRALCTLTGCKATRVPFKVIMNPEPIVNTYLGGTLITIRIHDSVVDVWRGEGAAPVFYRLPMPTTGLSPSTETAFTDGKVIDVPCRDTQGMASILRVPAASPAR